MSAAAGCGVAPMGRGRGSSSPLTPPPRLPASEYTVGGEFRARALFATREAAESGACAVIEENRANGLDSIRVETKTARITR